MLLKSACVFYYFPSKLAYNYILVNIIVTILTTCSLCCISGFVVDIIQVPLGVVMSIWGVVSATTIPDGACDRPSFVACQILVWYWVITAGASLLKLKYTGEENAKFREKTAIWAGILPVFTMVAVYAVSILEIEGVLGSGFENFV